VLRRQRLFLPQPQTAQNLLKPFFMPSIPALSPAVALSLALQELGQADQRRTYAAGTTIFATGDPGDGLYVIESGEVQILATIGTNESRPLATLGPGDFLGEMAVLDSAPRSAGARAAKDTVALYVSREDFLQLLDRRPTLALDLIREFSRRMRALNQKYIDEIVQAEVLATVGRFAGTIVHDFKTPLSTIGLYAELAAKEKATPATRAEAADGIARQITRLTDMLNEIIDVTRPSGRTVELTSADFAAFAAPLLLELRAQAEKSDCTLVADAPPARPVRLNAPRLSRLFFNLVGNASEAMPKGGPITVRFRVEENALHTEVHDAGPGIAPEIMERLFQPFATHGKTKGTGLGLAICRRIAEDHGGRIWARNEPAGGATFGFTLPLA
jgi:signal transduction histidine kinase